MKTFHILVFLITSLFLTACVSNKVFTDLESRYAELKDSHTLLKKKYDSLQVAHTDLEKALESKTQIL